MAGVLQGRQGFWHSKGHLHLAVLVSRPFGSEEQHAGLQHQHGRGRSALRWICGNCSWADVLGEGLLFVIYIVSISFLLLLVRHLLLVAWHLFLLAWHLFLVAS